MRDAHRVQVVRAAEQQLMSEVPEGALMLRAAAGLAAAAARRLGRLYGKRVVLLVGGGDNGGDALYAGALLARRGAAVTALTVSSKRHDAGALAALRAGARLRSAGDPSDEQLITDADLVIDGMLGIGGHGGLREDAARLARWAQPQRTLAVDLPSGIDADTGAVEGEAVRAGATITFGTIKPGLLVLPAAAYVGDLELVPIGLSLPGADLEQLEAADVAALLPTPGVEASKYTRGVLGITAGSNAYPGAAVLSTGGARAGGAGYLRFAGTAHPVELVRQRFPDVVATEVEPGDGKGVLAAGRVQAWVVGPGLGTGEEAAAVVRAVLSAEVPVLVDADGLTIVAKHPEWLHERADRGDVTLLTPHEGEFARLVGGEPDEVKKSLAADRLGAARQAAAALRATVLLKGSTTLVVDPDGSARVNGTGTGWLGSAGSGDVLSGLAGALLASGLSPRDAGSVGAYLHGLAAQLAIADAGPPLVALDLLAALRSAWALTADQAGIQR
ncbi:MAG: yjeF-like protein hydroxyethylthiazole kinaserelated [Mycobacterium sp.]|nr:yjeF-like protein hydroxyethylthiazole kinaserelated [Mycobacterium sp.]